MTKECKGCAFNPDVNYESCRSITRLHQIERFGIVYQLRRIVCVEFDVQLLAVGTNGVLSEAHPVGLFGQG